MKMGCMFHFMAIFTVFSVICDSQKADSLEQNENCEDVCLKEGCIHQSSRILSRLDKDTHPCHDFFRFACGEWQRSNMHRIEGDNMFYALNLNVMPDEMDVVLKGLLAGKIRIYEEFYQSLPFKHLELLYKSCMDLERIESEGFTPAAALLTSLKEFYVGRPFDGKSFDLTRATSELLHFNGAPLIDVNLDTSLKNVSKWGIVVSTPRHFGLLPTLIGPKFRKRHPGVKELFREGRKYLKRVIQNLENDLFILELLKMGSLKTKQEDDRKINPNPNSLSFYSKVIDNIGAINKFHANGSNDYNRNHNMGTKDMSNSMVGNSLEPFFNISFLGGNDTFRNDLGKNKEIDLQEGKENILTEASEDAVHEDNSKNKEAMLKMMQSLGIFPKISRKDLYQELQKEVKAHRKHNLMETLNKKEFLQLIDFMSFIMEDNETLRDQDRTDGRQRLSDKFLGDDIHGTYLEQKAQLLAMDKLLQFVITLRELEPTEREDVILLQQGKVFNTFTVKELIERFPFLEWKTFLNSLLRQTLPEDELIVVYYEEYMTKLSSLLQRSDPWVVHYGMLLMYVFDTLKELIEEDKDVRREHFCYMVTKESLSDAMSHMYLHHIGLDKLKRLRREVSPIIDAVRIVAMDTIRDSTWMLPPNKETALRKIKTMDWQIGGLERHSDIDFVQDIHANLELADQSFLENVISLYKTFRTDMYSYYPHPVNRTNLIWSFTAQPYTINAFHLQSTNSIVVPEAFFRPPYFDPSAPSYVNFGRTGMALAHEMLHAIDFTGSKFDHTGAMTNPFTPSMRQTLMSKITCFNTMVENEFWEMTVIENLQVTMDIDNGATLNENLADVAGLDLAYKALLLHSNTTEERDDFILPGIPYTRDQLFFISFAQPYCAILPGLAKVILLEIDEHLPHDIRINSVLMNFPKFAETFQCQPRDRMYNSKFCSVF